MVGEPIKQTNMSCRVSSFLSVVAAALIQASVVYSVTLLTSFIGGIWHYSIYDYVRLIDGGQALGS